CPLLLRRWDATRVQRAEGAPSSPLPEPMAPQRLLILVRALVLVLLEHVLDVVLEEQDVGLARSVDLEGGLVVPLDRAPQLFPVLEHDHHARAVRHLLRVVVALRGRLLRGDGLARPIELRRSVELLLDLGEVGADQLAIHFSPTSSSLCGWRLA